MTKFLNVVKCRWGSWGVVSSTRDSWLNPGDSSGNKATENFDLFTSGGQINSLKYKKTSNVVYFEWKFNSNML